jgi:hypothetical protein
MFEPAGICNLKRKERLGVRGHGVPPQAYVMVNLCKGFEGGFGLVHGFYLRQYELNSPLIPRRGPMVRGEVFNDENRFRLMVLAGHDLRHELPTNAAVDVDLAANELAGQRGCTDFDKKACLVGSAYEPGRRGVSLRGRRR